MNAALLDGAIGRLVLVVFLIVLVAVVLVVARALVVRRTSARVGRVLDAQLPVEHADAPTVLYFFGPGCSTCETQKRALTVLGESDGPVNIVPIDAAGQSELASWAGVMTVPSTAIVDSRRRLRVVNHGFKPASALAAQLASL